MLKKNIKSRVRDHKKHDFFVINKTMKQFFVYENTIFL